MDTVHNKDVQASAVPLLLGHLSSIIHRRDIANDEQIDTISVPMTRLSVCRSV
jgi:hypothetical protein